MDNEMIMETEEMVVTDLDTGVGLGTKLFYIGIGSGGTIAVMKLGPKLWNLVKKPFAKKAEPWEEPVEINSADDYEEIED